MLKAVGEYIDGSGLDSAFIEGDILEIAIIEQVKAEKHTKRLVESYLTSLHSVDSTDFNDMQNKFK